MKPSYLGGLGMNPTKAKQQAQTDVDAIIRSGLADQPPAAAPAEPPNVFLPPAGRRDPGGNVDLGAPEASGLTFPAAPAPGAPGAQGAPSAPAGGMADPAIVSEAVKRIKLGKGTVAQLEASGLPPATIAAIKARVQPRAPKRP
jgi:hypothetical protein